MKSLKKNPLTRNETWNWYDGDLDEKEKKLLLFALNNPKGKLADAIKHLKAEGYDRGLAPSTVSPLFKRVKEAADDVLKEEVLQRKVLSNPQYGAIKEKLNTLLQTKGDRPGEVVRNAFKGIDVDSYILASEELAKWGGKGGDRRLIYDGGQMWRPSLFSVASQRFSKPEFSTKYDGGFALNMTDFKVSEMESGNFMNPKYYETKWKHQLEVKEVGGETITPFDEVLIDNLHITKQNWVIDNEYISVSLFSRKFKNPSYSKLGGVQSVNRSSYAGYSSGSAPDKAYRTFYQKELWLLHKRGYIGTLLNNWINTKDRKRRIGTAKRIKVVVAELEKIDYTTTIGGVEYVSPTLTKEEWSYDPKQSPEEKTGSGYVMTKESPLDLKAPEGITVLPIRNKGKYVEKRDALLQALSGYSVPPVTVATRANQIGMESGKMGGEKGVSRGVVFGFGDNRYGYNYFRKNKQFPEVYKALVEFGEAIVPKGWDFQSIQLNHNVKAKKHTDKKNVGKSVIIGIGDYNGGDLRVFSPDSSKHKDYSIKDRPTMFNGALLPHETQAFSNPTAYEKGRGRYTIVYFRHKHSPTRGDVGVGKGRSEGLRQPSAVSLEGMFV
jgi:hypothetical protein